MKAYIQERVEEGQLLRVEAILYAARGPATVILEPCARLTAEEQNAIERAIVCMSDPEFFHQSEPLKNAVVVLSKMLEE